MIPILDLPGIARVPPNSLASRVDTIRLVFGHVNDNLQGFKGIPSICCSIKNGASICQVMCRPNFKNHRQNKNLIIIKMSCQNDLQVNKLILLNLKVLFKYSNTILNHDGDP